MSYASDQLYQGYIRRNLSKFVSKIDPCEIIVHLPCLTDHDRENIEAKRETRGKFDAVRFLLDCLKRRENWAEQFIAALEECEQRTLAAEVRAEYDHLRGINNPSPPAPPPAANIVMAHIHPAPSAERGHDPGTAARAQPVTPEPLPIQETIPPTPPAAPVLEVTTPAEPPQAQVEVQVKAVVVPPVTPPPSPETPRASANPTPLPEPMEFITHQEPEENTEPSLQNQNAPVEAINVEEVEEVPVAPREEPCETEATELLQAATVVDQPTLPPAFLEEPISTITNLDDPTATSTITEETKSTTSFEEESKLPSCFESDPFPASITVDQTTPVVEDPIATISSLDDPIAPSAITEEPKLPTSFESEPIEAAFIVDNPTPTPAMVEKAIASITDLDEPIATSTMTEEPKLPTIIVEKSAQTITFVEETAHDDSLPITAAVEAPPRSPSPPMTDLDDPILTPEKPPVQDTNPPSDTVMTAAPKLEGTSKPLDAKVVEIVQQIEVPSNPPPKVGNNDGLPNNEDPLSEDEEIYFSKPGILRSVEPPSQDTTLRVPTPDPDPYSGDSGRLEMSEEDANSKPEEEISKSPASSLDMEDVQENVGHVEEEPSNLNLDVQTPVILQVNGETAKEISSVLPTSDTTLISCNVAHVAEEPSIVNQEVETPLIQANGEAAKESSSFLPTSDTTLISCNVDQETLKWEEETSLIQANGETAKEITLAPSTPPSMISATSCNMEQDAEEPSILNQEVQTPLIHVNGERAPATPDISDVSSIVVHFEEEPSILNQDVQTPLIQVNGEKAKEITPIPATPVILISDNHHPNEPALCPKQPGSEETATSGLNTRYILTAAGVGACALLIAWRFKH